MPHTIRVDTHRGYCAMDVHEAIREAEAVLPGVPAAEGQEDARWQALIAVGQFIESDPDAVWEFIRRWGVNNDEDLRDAIATCLLENLLEYHFTTYFALVEQLALSDRLFRDTFRRCWQLGQAEEPGNAERFIALRARLD
jgi:hypothetical protein